MTRRQKINVVIEVELIESDQIIPSPSIQITEAVPGATLLMAADLLHEQALLAALRADPSSYVEFVKTIVVGCLETFRLNFMIPELAQIHDAYTASLDVLENLLPRLPLAAQAHFQQGIREGWISEGTLSIFNAVQVDPVRLTVEYPVDPSLSVGSA